MAHERKFDESGNLLEQIIGRDGLFFGGRLLSREPIYIGRNGKAVERIIVEHEGRNVPLIFKPLTNADSIGKEVWADRQLLMELPMIRYPRIVGESDVRNPDDYWLLYEDLGELRHAYDERTLKAAAMQIPNWHLLPLEKVPAQFEGHTPKAEQVWNMLKDAQDEVLTALTALGLRHRWLTCLADEFFQREPAEFEGETVICHGDLNPLNIAMLGEELIILDWEYVHRNSVYWDLYNLLDITSPVHRRPVLEPESRLSVLHAYAAKRESLGKPVNTDYIAGYHSYCLAYSVWLILLIGRDLANGRFDRDALEKQRSETIAICEHMLQFLYPTP